MSLVVLLASGGQQGHSPAVDELFQSLADDDRFDAKRFRALSGQIGS